MMKNLTPEMKKELFPENLILMGYRGSIAHNMYIPNTDPNSIDDIDLMGVFMAPVEHYIGITKTKETVEKFIGKYDFVSYELIKFVKLLLKSNPNVLSLLWIKNNMYLKRHKYGQALIDNRNLFVSKIAYKSFTGYVYGQLKKMEKFNFEGYMGDRRKQLVKKVGYDCYSSDTEFLTQEGWKVFDDITCEDNLATLFINDGKLPMNHKTELGIEYQSYIDKFDGMFNGDMYKFIGYHIDSLVTPNHRMLIKEHSRKMNKDSDLKLVEAGLLSDSFKFLRLISPIKTVYKNPKELQNLPIKYEQYIALMGWFLSDGTLGFRNKKVKYLSISQIKGGRLHNNMSKLYNKIKDKVKSGFYIYKIRPNGFRSTSGYEVRLNISDNILRNKIYEECGHSKEKRIPRYIFQLSVRLKKMLLFNLLLGDGTKKFEGCHVYYSSVKDLADDVQELAFLCGYETSLYGPYNSNGTDMYQVYITKNTKQFKQLIRCRNIKKVGVKNHRVVCFTVPNGVLITRRNGKIGIHGNSKNASHCIRLLKMSIEFLTTGKLNVFRQDAPMLLEIKTGKWSLERVKAEAERLFKLADEAYVRSKISNEPEYDKVEKIVKDIMYDYIRSTDDC